MLWHQTIVTIVKALTILLISAAPVVSGEINVKFAAEDIPVRLPVSASMIFTDSDSLYLGDSLLTRNEDYTFRSVPSGAGYFDLSGLVGSKGDTLTVQYRPVPSWVKLTYGRPLPEPGSEGGNVPVPSPKSRARESGFGSDVKLSGAKSFRFSTRTAGNSDFGQSLDLNISGELSPGLSISGAITDRGFDPAYGTANSRLSELDKVSITLKSRVVDARLGDIVIAGVPGQPASKSVSGASFELQYPNWHVGAVAARPRGRFETFSFIGQDGLQGPYQVGAGANAQPIVPGSESVWLDGRKLERGTSKDYTVDYPTGRITFNVDHPIDRRSRIEVDYEPQSTDYKKELFSSGGGARFGDSAFYFSVEVLREGDDSDQPLVGDLTEQDRVLLGASGDADAVVSGVRPDTAGAYVLDTAFTDSVYSFVGEGNGEYSVTFSFVGVGKGDYRLLGNGNYEFVGAGLGDYLPVNIIAAPERVDNYRAVLGMRSPHFGEVTADIRQTQYDRNLLSGVGDDDNDGLFVSLSQKKNWRWNGHTNTIGVFGRLREVDYFSRERLNRADFDREFLLPTGFVPASDEVIVEADASVSPLKHLTLTPFFHTVDYENQFESNYGGVGALVAPADNLEIRSSWSVLSSNLTDTDSEGAGSAYNVSAGVNYRVAPGITLASRFERDSRDDEYGDALEGARYNRVTVEAARYGEKVRWERYAEDSLRTDWSEVLIRNRVSGGSTRRFGDLSYDLTTTYQWLRKTAAKEDNFLGRLNVRYMNSLKRMSIASTYLISEEQRNARGITYLEVEPGEGNFVFENGEYVPDPDGNFIRVDEILSETDRVRRGQKSFQFSKDWRVVLVRFDSRIEEELLEEGKRDALWVIPFYADDSEPYLFFDRRYSGTLKGLPIAGFYVFNFDFSHDTEIRSVADQARRRRDIRGELALKQKIGGTYLEQAVSLFESSRDAYFSGAGDIDGFKGRVGVRQLVARGQITGGASFRRAESSVDERSDTYSVLAGTRFPILGKGELRSEIELYSQEFTNVSGIPSYQLTDNKPGEKGAIWSVSLKYGVRESLRINFSVSGRHADDRTARIVSRGEVVAGF